MDFKDFSARMKAAKQTDDQQDDRPFDAAESYRLRAKMLGVLIRDARVNADRSIDDCARLLKLAPEEFEQWEFGDISPSLPELEVLASYLDVPVSHFWGAKTLETDHADKRSTQQTFIDLRNHMIGVLLRQAREERGMDITQLSEETQIDADLLEQYELGELPIPMHELSAISSVVNQNMSYFLESESQIGEMLASLEAWKHFNDLPDDLRAFAANPLNIGFIEIALAFSQMENDRLKRIAVSMLDITGY